MRTFSRHRTLTLSRSRYCAPFRNPIPLSCIYEMLQSSLALPPPPALLSSLCSAESAELRSSSDPLPSLASVFFLALSVVRTPLFQNLGRYADYRMAVIWDVGELVFSPSQPHEFDTQRSRCKHGKTVWSLHALYPVLIMRQGTRASIMARQPGFLHDMLHGKAAERIKLWRA